MEEEEEEEVAFAADADGGGFCFCWVWRGHGEEGAFLLLAGDLATAEVAVAVEEGSVAGAAVVGRWREERG